MILESKERELSSKLGLLTKENAVLQRECESLKIDSKNLEFSKYSQEKTLTEFMVKNESLDKQMQGKDEIINKNKEILENAYRQRVILLTKKKKNVFKKDMSESNLNEAKKNIEKLEIKLNKCSEEITKGNDIIRQLQDDITKKKEKIKLKNSLIVQQEQTINQINENCDKYIRQINQCIF